MEVVKVVVVGAPGSSLAWPSALPLAPPCKLWLASPPLLLASPVWVVVKGVVVWGKGP